MGGGAWKERADKLREKKERFCSREKERKGRKDESPAKRTNVRDVDFSSLRRGSVTGEMVSTRVLKMGEQRKGERCGKDWSGGGGGFSRKERDHLEFEKLAVEEREQRIAK